MSPDLFISPQGRPGIESIESDELPVMSAVAGGRIEHAFAAGPGPGLLHLATAELQTSLPASLAFAREIGRRYLTCLCHMPDGGITIEPETVPPPAEQELAVLVLQAPPMKGLEYLDVPVLKQWWSALDEHVRQEIRDHPGGLNAYLHDKNPLWRTVGRVTFHLAENKRDEAHPFAFMATYAHRLSEHGRVQHLPLARALKEYAGARDRPRLLSLLTPIDRAAERSPWVRELVDTGAVYQALAWTPRQAHAFLQDIPALEASGLIVRVPDWWKAARPPRPRVSVTVGEGRKTGMGAEALLDFSVNVALDDEPLSEREMQEIFGASGGLVRLRGRWVEVDRDKLNEALAHWKRVEREARHGEVSFFEGMRMLSRAFLEEERAAQPDEGLREWTGVKPGAWLQQTLDELRDPQALTEAAPTGLRATLRPYQQAGVHWLRFITRLELGGCLADDMGLGKTIQVLALLLHAKREAASTNGSLPPSLLVLPASLIANWNAEIARFAPVLSTFTAHPAETRIDLKNPAALDEALIGCDLVITTYGMVHRLESLRQRRWRLVILDEAQAIKNSGTRQTRAVKQLEASARLALTGTPIENRLSDLWSLFDFLNPGLMGNAASFKRFSKRLAQDDPNRFAPLRKLVRPYILRRLKTDRRIITDLPEKTEVTAFCGLSREQAALYEQSVRELADQLGAAEGIGRRGLVLAYLLRLKQICNHPAQWRGDGDYNARQSGKFQRLAALAEELSQRQDKALIFTQYREITQPLAEHLARVFGRPGLVLHGGTPVSKRPKLVEAFEREEGPPFFILSLKAGGTGLNLTAASHVIHFDRWWNPAVENQATDRAFRIGQKRNVLVHKFVCRGTVEEKIDRLIAEKLNLARDLLDEGGENLLTEMNDQELLDFVALDINKASEL